MKNLQLGPGQTVSCSDAYFEVEFNGRTASQRRKLYVDLNGVLADMSGAIRAIGGERETPEQVEEFYRKATQASIEEWKKVTRVIPEGNRMWQAIRKYNPVILSSTGVGPQWDVHRDKLVAVKDAIIQHFYPGAEFVSVPSKDKSPWAAGGNVLVDDSPKKLALWEAAGGIPVLFDRANVEQVTRKVDEVMSLPQGKTAAIQRASLQREAPGLLQAADGIKGGHGQSSTAQFEGTQRTPSRPAAIRLGRSRRMGEGSPTGRRRAVE